MHLRQTANGKLGEPLIKAEFSGSRGLAVRCICMAQMRLSSTD